MALVQTLRCSVTINPGATGRERFMNTWHIATRDATTPIQAADEFKTHLDAFYQAVDSHMSNLLSGEVPRLDVWNLIELKPRQPIKSYSLTALTTAANRAPRELACCVSYRATYDSGVTPKRRRGRIYLGPMSDSAFDGTTGLIAAATVTAVQGAADVLQSQSAASTKYAWVVYSPTTDVVGNGETGMFEVIGGWVDSTPDVQRRRGTDSSVRSTF